MTTPLCLRNAGAFGCLLSLLALLAPAATYADTAAKQQEQLIRQLYAQSDELICTGAKKLPRFFTASLARDTARACNANLMGLEVDRPIVPGSDLDLKEVMATLRVKCTQAVTSTCTANFAHLGSRHSIRYLLAQDGKRWVVADIIDDHGTSYQRELASALKR